MDRCGRPISLRDQQLWLAFIATLTRPTTLTLEETP
jgi:hypothetical protein